MSGNVWVVILCFCAFGVRAQESQALRQLLRTEGLKQAAIGISVKRVTDGAAVVEYNPNMALTPASVMKLLPTWFALQEKGKNYKFRTQVFYSGVIQEGCLSGDIILKSGGDPTPDSRYFPDYSLVAALVTAIEQAGICRIQGKIKVEGTRKGTDIPGSWPWEDVSNYYGALYLPFNYRDNTFTLQFQSGSAGTRAKLISLIPALPELRVDCEVESVAINKDNAWIYGGPFSTTLCVKGSIPANRKAFAVKGAMHDPAAFFVHELSEELAKKKILVEQKSVQDKKRTILLDYDSPGLEDVIFHTNKSSVNLFAEALGHLVGGNEWPGKVKLLLAGLEIDGSGIILNDACGLSPLDAVPSQVFTDLLVSIGRQENSAFMLSLPVAGVDGGLAAYCRSSLLLKGKLKAKTGSMSGVRGLAGYLIRNNGEQLAFTILINHYTCPVAQLQQAVGEFLTELM